MSRIQHCIQNLLTQINSNNANAPQMKAEKRMLQKQLQRTLRSYPEYLMDALHPDWIQRLSTSHTPSLDSHLMVKSLPLLDTHYRWTRVSWLDLPCFSWQLIESIWCKLACQNEIPGIASCYAFSLSQMPQSPDLSSWIQYKLSLENAQIFIEELKNPLPVKELSDAENWLNGTLKESL